MKIVLTLAASTIAGLCLVGSADAMPVARVGASQAPVVDAAIVLRTVRRRPFVRVIPRRVFRRRPVVRIIR